MLQGDATQLGSAENGMVPAEFFEIRIATLPLPIRIEYSAIRSLHSAMAPQDQAIGLLVGTSSPEGLSVDHCELIRDSANAESFIRARLGHPADRIVGFFRTQPAGWPELQAVDRDIAKRCFGQAGSLFLLIQTPGHRPWSAAVFEFDAEGVSPANTPALEFFFDEYLLRSGYLTPLVPGPEYLSHQEQPTSPHRKTQMIVLIGIAVLFVLAIAGYIWSGRDRVEVSGVSSTSSGLSLKVVRSGKDYEVSWDRLSPALQQATGGSVTIRDGELTRTVSLNLAQLHEGRILYTPLFGELSVRLEIQQGVRSQAESVQILSWNGSSPDLVASLPPVQSTTALPANSSPALMRPVTQQSLATTQPANSVARPLASVIPNAPPAVRQELPTAVAPAAPASSTPVPGDNSGVKPQATPPAAAVNPATTAGQPFSFFDRPADTKPVNQQPPPTAAPVNKTSTPVVERPAVVPPLPTPVQPSASVTLPTRTPTPDPIYVPPVAIAKTSPKITREVKWAVDSVPGRQVKVSVKVSVDTNGNVRSAELIPQSGQTIFGDTYIKNAAIEAAKQWKFRPGTLNGKPVTGDMTLYFNFQ